MSIFTQEPKVSKSAWHYKLLNLIYDKWDMPKTQCSYFWTVLIAIITFPLWIIGALWDRFSYDYCGSIHKAMGTTIIILFVLAFVGCILTGTFFLGDMLFNNAELFKDLFVIDVNAEDIFSDENMTSLGNLMFGMVVINIIAIGIGFLFAIVKLFKELILLCSDIVTAKFGGVVTEFKEEEPNNLTFVGSFINMIRDKKNKVCKPIEYVEEEE